MKSRNVFGRLSLFFFALLTAFLLPLTVLAAGTEEPGVEGAELIRWAGALPGQNEPLRRGTLALLLAKAAGTGVESEEEAASWANESLRLSEEESLSLSDKTVSYQELCLYLSRYLSVAGLALPAYRGEVLIESKLSSAYSQAVHQMADALVVKPKEIPDFTRSVTLSETMESLDRFLLYATLEEDMEGMPLSDLAESEAVDESFFEGACFIGHSLVRCMQSYFHVDADFYGMNGATVSKGLEYSYKMPDQSTATLRYALSTHSYKKVYIMYGINELIAGKDDAELYFAGMKKLIGMVQETQPEAEIFLLSVTPVGKFLHYEPAYSHKNMQNLNRVIKNISRYYGVHYLDLFTLLADGEGYMIPEAESIDHLHWSAEGCDIVKDYLLRHTA